MKLRSNHWMSAKYAKKAEVRLDENIVDEELEVYNEDSSLKWKPNSLMGIVSLKSSYKLSINK